MRSEHAPTVRTSRTAGLSLHTIVRAVADWADRRKTRGALQKLDTHMLHDIGLLPEEARMECTKPFWKD
jgi:uncharacterized protein YjiS (DUF1127 family)